MTSTWRVLALVTVALACGVAAWAMPPYQDALFARYPNAAASFPSCVACHDSPAANGFNPFGSAFLANGLVFNAALEALDSDGDGVTNGAELTASPATLPGDPTSKPGSAGTPTPTPTPTPAPTPTPVPVADGATLYASNCASCHGALASSTKTGATLARLQGAIAGNTGGMGFLSTLSPAQVQAIISALAPAAAAQSLNYTGMWWNPAESGWGINVNHQGDVVFATLFTYDQTGAPMWVLASAWLQHGSQTYVGDLYRTNGPPFNAQPFQPITQANLVKVGTLSLAFSSASTARLSYTYQGVAVAKDIVPQIFGTAAASCSGTTASRVALTNYQDMWWNPAESGWGVNVVHQNGTLFATLMTYDLAGNNLWLVMPAGPSQPDGAYQGDLYRVNGPAFDSQPFPPITAANLVKVGTMRFAFTDGITGTLAYTVDAIAVSKSITRQVFASPVPACSSPVQPSSSASGGAALYATHCATCHGALAASTKGGVTLARAQSAIAGNTGGMGYLSALSTADLEAIVTALASVAPSATPACGSCHSIPPSSGDHAKHDQRFSCSSCHGSGYSATSVNAATHNNGNLDLIANIGWNATSNSCSNACHGTASWSRTATLGCGSCHAIPPSSGDHVRHNSRFTCSSCHGSGYSATSVNSTTHNNGTTNVIATIGWNASSRTCSNSCHGTMPWSASATLACGSCHAIPPNSGQHGEHRSRSCGDCHGSGYTSTTVKSATHNNGTKDVAASSGWSATSRTCTNSCHGKESW